MPHAVETDLSRTDKEAKANFSVNDKNAEVASLSEQSKEQPDRCATKWYGRRRWYGRPHESKCAKDQKRRIGRK